MTLHTESSSTGCPLPSDQRNSELILICFSGFIVLLALIIVEMSNSHEIHSSIIMYFIIFFSLFIFAHGIIRRFARYADPLLFPTVSLLNGLGLVMIHRLDLGIELTNAEKTHHNAHGQMMWTCLGILSFTLVLALCQDHRKLAGRRYLTGLVGLFLLLIPVLLPSSLSEQQGAKIWIRIAGFSLQPAEFAKILLLISFSAILIDKRQLFTSTGKHVFGFNLPYLKDLAPLLIAWASSVGIMLLEKDLGTSLLLYIIFLVLIYLVTRQVVFIIVGLGLFFLGSVGCYFFFSHVRIRVHTWLDPFADPEGIGYQMVQSLFSFATGGVLGTGLGNGQPNYVPEAATDFIIAAFGEELGLTGLAGILLLYTIIIVRGMRTAIVVRDSFGKLLAAGLATTLGIQLFIVTGGVTRLIPLTGLTTPWLSYGGSSLLANYILLAIILRISHAARQPLSNIPNDPTFSSSKYDSLTGI